MAIANPRTAGGARETPRARSDLLKQHAVSQREQAQTLAIRLMHALSESDGHAHGDRGDRFSLRLARMPELVALVPPPVHWLDDHGVASDDQADITLACSEACANAVEHPGVAPAAWPSRSRRGARTASCSSRSVTSARGQTHRRGDPGPRPAHDPLADGRVEITSSDEGTKISMRRTLASPGKLRG